MQPKVRGTTSRQPDQQRKALFRAPPNVRRRRMALPLSRELRARYGRRRITVRKGDTVRVLGGTFKGREERVAKVDLRDYWVILDNVTLRKADKKLKQLPLSTGHLMITKLNLSDPWRRRVLKAPEEAAAEAAEEETEAKGSEEKEEGADREKGSEKPSAAPAKGKGEDEEEDDDEDAKDDAKEG